MRDRLLPALILAVMAVTKPTWAAEATTKGVVTQGSTTASEEEATLTAAIMPGIGREARVAPLPKPLTPQDVAAYKRALNLQSEHQWAAADRELARVEDDMLKGHVLAQRYLDQSYRPRYPELRAWMADYADLPQAEAIYEAATRKGMKGFGAIKQPVRGSLKGGGIDTSDEGANWEDSAYVSDHGSSKARAIKNNIRALLRKGNDAAALAVMTGSEARALDRLDMDEMKLALALDHYVSGRDAEAAAWASQAAERSGDDLPGARWVAGLALWRQGKPEMARFHFEALANSDRSSPWLISASAFWAARSNLVAHHPELVNHWLEIAATYPRTFYGLLARQTLGYEIQFSWETPPFTEADADVLGRIPGARRAFALLQINDRQAAEDELRKAYPRATKTVRQSIMVMAQVADMPTLAVRLGGSTPGMGNDAASFPMPSITPKGGWQVDKALVYAVIRQESSFNPKTKSSSGATGLMQIMPATAVHVAGRQALERLADNDTNLNLGQRYLQQLLGEDQINGNLMMLVAAYNAGPGKLAQWTSSVKFNNDPLLFVESLPSRETRSYVERVMTNYWVYRARMGQPSSSLEAVATGAWPQYEGMDPSLVKRKGSRS